jgi:hypothetical protein
VRRVYDEDLWGVHQLIAQSLTKPVVVTSMREARVDETQITRGYIVSSEEEDFPSKRAMFSGHLAARTALR